MGNGPRVGALQMTCFFGGFACLVAAAIAGGSQPAVWAALAGAAPWLFGAVALWAGVVWPDLRGRRRRRLLALTISAMWVAAVALAAAGVVAFLAAVALALPATRLLLRRGSGEGPAATMDAQT